jgi:hypothetical protein
VHYFIMLKFFLNKIRLCGENGQIDFEFLSFF